MDYGRDRDYPPKRVAFPPAMKADTPELSLVIPAWNEENNLDRLKTSLIQVLEEVGRSFEILFIDDGSTDGTFARIAAFAAEDPRILGIRMRKNMGKSNALAAGFEKARGKVVLTLDADNQDDPTEIPRFLAKIDEGFDLVSGWKKLRHDPPGRVRASHLFNAAIRWVSGIHLHDFNCGFKAYRAEVVKSIPLYGEWHRFIPVLAADRGFRVTEVEVHHHPRTHGKSRYGFERYFRGFADCLSLLVISRFGERPGHFLMGIGFILVVLSVFLHIAFALAQAAFSPLMSGWIGVLAFIGTGFGSFPVIGVQFILAGLLAELIVAQNPPRRFQAAIAEIVGAAGSGERESISRD